MAKIFEKKYRVPATDVNAMEHVDNQIYLRWMNEVAIEHSSLCGWTIQDYLNLGSAFVAKSHFIEYLAPTFENEELLFMTWVEDMDTRQSIRKYRFFKLPDYRPFLRAETKWVYVDMEKGRPMDIPDVVCRSFHVSSEATFQARLAELKSERA